MTGELCSLCRRILLLTGLFFAAWTDLKEGRIPNRILALLLLAGIVLCTAQSGLDGEYEAVRSAAAGFFTGGGIALLCAVLSGGGLGAGDVKLLAVTGLYLGAGAVADVFVFAMLSAGAVCLALLAAGRGGRKRGIPLAPFILLAVVLTYGKQGLF